MYNQNMTFVPELIYSSANCIDAEAAKCKFLALHPNELSINVMEDNYSQKLNMWIASMTDAVNEINGN